MVDAWEAETIIDDLRTCDIGLMPATNDVGEPCGADRWPNVRGGSEGGSHPLRDYDDSAVWKAPETEGALTHYVDPASEGGLTDADG